MTHTLTLDEAERQLVLMALARLAVDRPGFEAALWCIAQKIDNPAGSKGCVYESFKRIFRGEEVES